jgi:hypothetical protein
MSEITRVGVDLAKNVIHPSSTVACKLLINNMKIVPFQAP